MIKKRMGCDRKTINRTGKLATRCTGRLQRVQAGRPFPRMSCHRVGLIDKIVAAALVLIQLQLGTAEGVPHTIGHLLHHTVQDSKITDGTITALVLGSRDDPRRPLVSLLIGAGWSRSIGVARLIEVTPVVNGVAEGNARPLQQNAAMCTVLK